MIDLGDLPRHTRDSGVDGYIYIIRLSTGVVKVGKTRNPQGRIATHAANAAKFGASVETVWLSERHQNYSNNERELITALGVPFHGAEYFRVEFTEAVHIAEQFDYEVLTEQQRNDRNSQVNEESQRKARALFKSLDGGDFTRIKVPTEEAHPFLVLFGDSLPAGFAESADDDTPEQMESLLLDLAEKTGIPVEEIEQWSYIDIIEHLAKTAIRIQSLRVQNRALDKGRTDLTQPVFSPVVTA